MAKYFSDIWSDSGAVQERFLLLIFWPVGTPSSHLLLTVFSVFFRDAFIIKELYETYYTTCMACEIPSVRPFQLFVFFFRMHFSVYSTVRSRGKK